MNAKFEKMQTSTLQKMLTLATTTEADKADIQEILDARESGVAAAPAPAPESAAAKAQAPKKEKAVKAEKKEKAVKAEKKEKAVKAKKKEKEKAPKEKTAEEQALEESKAKYNAAKTQAKELRREMYSRIAAMREELVSADNALHGKTLSYKLRGGETMTGKCAGIVLDKRGPIYIVRMDMGDGVMKYPSLNSLIVTPEIKPTVDLYLSHLEMLSAEAKLQTIDDEIAKLQALKPELEAMVAGWNESETSKAFAVASNKRAEAKRQEQEIRDEYAAKIEGLDYGDYQPASEPAAKKKKKKAVAKTVETEAEAAEGEVVYEAPAEEVEGEVNDPLM